MSREIKFRGMDLQGGWHYGLLANTWEYGWTIGNARGVPTAYKIRPETRGQFTGMLDKDGREIFEGDIVEHPIPGLDRTTWVIVYDPLAMAFVGAAQSYDQLVAGADMWIMDTGKATRDSIRYENGNYILAEVIGNIYENPELLTKAA